MGEWRFYLYLLNEVQSFDKVKNSNVMTGDEGKFICFVFLNVVDIYLLLVH